MTAIIQIYQTIFRKNKARFKQDFCSKLVRRKYYIINIMKRLKGSDEQVNNGGLR